MKVFYKKKKKKSITCEWVCVWDVDFECLPLRGKPAHTSHFLDSISVLLMFFSWLPGADGHVSEDFWFWFAVIDATEGQCIGKHAPDWKQTSTWRWQVWYYLVQWGIIRFTVLKGGWIMKSVKSKNWSANQKKALLSSNLEFCGVRLVQTLQGKDVILHV